MEIQCSNCSPRCGLYRSFVKSSCESLRVNCESLSHLFSDHSDDIKKVRDAVALAGYYIEQGEYLSSRSTLQITNPIAANLSRISCPDPFSRYSVASMYKLYSAIQTNAIDTCIKICRKERSSSSLLRSSDDILSLTPAGFRDLIRDSDVTERAAQVFEELYPVFALRRNIFSISIEDHNDGMSRFWPTHPETCIYCQIRLEHCYDSCYRFVRQCTVDDCIGCKNIYDTLDSGITVENARMINYYRFALAYWTFTTLGYAVDPEKTPLQDTHTYIYPSNTYTSALTLLTEEAYNIVTMKVMTLTGRRDWNRLYEPETF